MADRSHEAVDVVIMGSGATGSLLAARAAESGRSVVILESGPARKLSDLISSQIWARRLKWHGAPIEQGGPDRVGLAFGMGAGTGGSALHHYGFWPRLLPADFHMQSDTGRGRDWPIAYDVLRPWYDRVQAEVGIAGDAEAEIWRPAGAPYPMPAHPWFAQQRLIARGFAALGMHVAPAPLAIASVPFGDRAACLHDGWCDAGCPIRALANPLVAYIPRAIAAGAVLKTGCQVVRVETMRGGATGLIYADSEGAFHRQPAQTVILAGAPIQNARLLLASAEGGLGNRSGMVGRGFAMHLLATGHALFAEETACHMGVSAALAMSLDDYAKHRDGPFGSVFWGLGPAMKPNDLLGLANTRPDISGDPLHRFMRRAARHLGTVNAIIETVPRPENRIRLSARKDGHGVPLPHLEHALDQDALALFPWANERARRLLEAAGAAEVWVAQRPGHAHVSGGTVMGNDPTTSVCDSFGRVHEVRDLLVAGAGLLPTIGALSPTFTLLALAERTADTMGWRQGPLLHNAQA
jgi:choline dehydrogenase-like flavoprotein